MQVTCAICDKSSADHAGQFIGDVWVCSRECETKLATQGDDADEPTIRCRYCKGDERAYACDCV